MNSNPFTSTFLFFPSGFRVESRIEIDRKSFLAASGKAFKECAKTLHDVLCREISSRNEKAARARCQQLIDHILIQAEMMLQEAISSCRRNRQRINMAAVMKVKLNFFDS